MTVKLFFTSIVINTFLIHRLGAQVSDISNQLQLLPPLALQCPKNSQFCDCYDVSQKLECSVKTEGNFEQQFEQYLVETKEKSQNAESNEPILLQELILAHNDLMKLDLVLLDAFSLIEVKISTNFALRKITGGLNLTSIFRNVTSVIIESSPELDDTGLGDTLQAFSSSQKLIKLHLSENSLTGNEEGPEFLPGFSSLVFVEELNLKGNKITKIYTKHFQHLLRLKYLGLSHNHIVSVKGSLLFVQNNLNGLYINMEYNLINELSIEVNKTKDSSTNNLIRNEQLVILDLENNKLTSLPFEIFHDFLQGNPKNKLKILGNQLVCGKQTKWLTESSSNHFETQIEGARCSNLQGALLFKETEKELLNSKLICPDPLQITPCTCGSSIKISITCAGDEIVQQSIDNVVQVLRQQRGTSSSQPLDIRNFIVQNTQLLELNLTPLFGMEMFLLAIASNKLLTKITSNQMIPGSIHVEQMYIITNPMLMGKGLGDTLKLFSSDLQVLNLVGNSLQGHFKDESNFSEIKVIEREFFPGLAQLYNLKELDLGANKIEHLGVGRFRNNSKLEDFSINENQISTLQKNVFFFKDSINKKTDGKIIKIDLGQNLLNVNSFPINVFGLTPVILNLESNFNLSEKNLFPQIDGQYVWSKETWRAISLGLIYDNSNTFPFPVLICPDPQEIYPCSCIENYAEIVCIGEEVTQKSVETLFQKLKNLNSAKMNSKLFIEKLKLVSTSITELDLSPLNNCNISTLFIFGNPYLTQITTNNFSVSSLIVFSELIIECNRNLEDSGIKNLLTVFEPDIEILSFAENSLTLNTTLNGLSKLKKLKIFNLRNNKILRLSPNFFNGIINRRLEHLDLSENQIEQIDQDAFGFFPDKKLDKNSSPLVINLNFNSIRENSFPLSHTGLERLQRPIQLNLVHNKMTTLPFAPFHSIFTDASEKFQIDLYGNPLNCDWQLNWLEKSSIFNSSSSVWIENAECINQPRKFIHNFQKPDTGNFCTEFQNVWPCSCDSSSNSLECLGDEITVKGFYDLFLKIRRLDPFCSGIFPGLDKFVISSKHLTQLDLTLFFQVCLTNLTSLMIDSNSKLSRIVGPPLTNSSMGDSIKVQTLEITSNFLTDEGLGSTLKYFSPHMKTLILNGNKLVANFSSFELFPGLSNLKNLVRVELKSNQIVSLPNGLLSFSTTTQNNNGTLVVDLSSNFLTDESFGEKIFDEMPSRPLNLILNQNNLTTIPSVPFQTFLEANSANQLNLEGNNLKCDEKLDWIKNRKDEFNRTRILNAECEGDSIFNSKYFNAVVKTVADKGVLAIVLGIVIPSILILTFLAVYQWKKSKRFRDEILYLSSAFRQGNCNLSPEDLHAAILSRPFNEDLEIPREKLVFKKTNVLGYGQFGMVYKGIFKSKSGNITVALKTVTASADLETFKSLLTEIKILDYLGSHQNIIQFFGAVTTNLEKSGDVLAVLEFCQNGDLLSYISERRNNFQDVFANKSPTAPAEESMTSSKNRSKITLTTVQLLKFAMGIANGLEFLRVKKVIHGDLAARNILLTKKLETKISDFGLAHQLRNYPIYFKTTECPLPLRWMSIEAIKDMNFSICSDIWSFGVVLYEIFSLGEIPYPGFAIDQEFLPRLLRGYLMDKPKYADQQIYELMLDTWKLEPHDRPTSDEIVSRLEQILDQITKGAELRL